MVSVSSCPDLPENWSARLVDQLSFDKYDQII